MLMDFVSSIDSHNSHSFYVNSKNVEITHASDRNEVVETLINNFKNDLEKQKQILRGGSDYIYNRVDFTGISFHNIKLKRGASSITPLKWILNKKTIINSMITNDNYCFAYSITAALQHEEIGKNPQRISKFRPFVNSYNWNDISFPAASVNFKIFEQNNKNIALNVLSIEPFKKELFTTYRSKFNKEREKQVIILMINENETVELEEHKYHYVAVKRLSRLCRNVISNHNGDAYCLNCLHSFSSKRSIKKHEKIRHNHDHC